MHGSARLSGQLLPLRPAQAGPALHHEYSKREDDEVTIDRPKIHRTVFRRIRNHAHAYAPIGLPAVYDVVTEDGSIVTPDQSPRMQVPARKRGRTRRIIVWNEIWKQRLLYFGNRWRHRHIAGFFCWFAGAKWVRPTHQPDPRGFGRHPHGRRISAELRPLTWVDGYARAPGSFLIMVGVVAFFTLWGMRKATRIADLMGTTAGNSLARCSGLPGGFIYRLRSHRFYIAVHEGLKRNWALALSALLFVYLGIALVTGLAYNILDVAGFTCTVSPTVRGLAKGETVTTPVVFKTSDLCKATGIHLDNGGRYTVKVEPILSWGPGTIPAFWFRSAASPRPIRPDWKQRIKLGFAVPLRRELTKDWFRIVLRYGDVGGEEVFSGS